MSGFPHAQNSKKTKRTTWFLKGGGGGVWLTLKPKIKEDIRYRQGLVKSVGELVQGVKDNDKIYYDKNAGFNIEIDEEIFLVIKQQDVVMVL